MKMAQVNEDAEEYWISDSGSRRKLEDEYLLGDIIGKGMFSTIHKCLRKGRTEWICKTLDKKHIDKNLLKDQIPKLVQLRHPNIVEVREVFETATSLQLIIEYADGGEIFERIVSRGHFSEKDAAAAVRDILSGLQYLHNRGVIHGNLKPENLLYETDMDDSKLKLTDFGLGQLFLDRKKYVANLTGALHYSAPEFDLGNEIDFSVDLWSVGFVMYIMLSGYEPFWDEGGQESIRKTITEGSYSFSSPLWDDISESAKELICKLLNVDPKRRPTAEETLQHPWTRGLTSPSVPRSKMITGLREYKARHRFRVATKAVLATRRALHLLKSNASSDDSESGNGFAENFDPDDDGVKEATRFQDRNLYWGSARSFLGYPVEGSSRREGSRDQMSQSLTTR